MKATPFFFSFAFVFLLGMLGGKGGANFHLAGESCCPAQFDSVSGKNVCAFVEAMPTYPGGELALLNFFTSRCRLTDTSDLQTTFHLVFVVDNTGKVLGGRIAKKKPAEYTPSEKSMLKVLDSMPLWEPGLCNNKPVNILLSIPIRIVWKR
ncbi:MAG: hypothetical protein IM638_13960 [Bacteroidetes bacterium]|nr:hypothetical protein [Bacteroidota bacterium]